MSIDERLRTAATELHRELDGPLPPLLDHRPARTGRVVAIAAVTVAALVGGLVVLAGRSDDQPLGSPDPTPTAVPTATDPSATNSPSIPDASAPTPDSTQPDEPIGPTDPAPSAPPPSTLGEFDFLRWAGTFRVASDEVDALLGTVGSLELRLTSSPSSFCITDQDGGGGCTSTGDGTPLPVERTAFSGSRESGDHWFGYYVVPDDVTLDVRSGDRSVCDVVRLPLEPYAPASLWGCEVWGALPADTVWVATRAGETVTVPVELTVSTPPTPGTSEPGTTTAAATLAVGDSLMLGAAEVLAERGVVVDAVISRSPWELTELITQLPPTTAIVLHVGANGPFDAVDLDAAIASLSDRDLVVVVTTQPVRNWIGPNNELLRALPERFSNVVVADWASMVERGEIPGIAADGLHLATDEAKQAYVDAILAPIADTTAP